MSRKLLKLLRPRRYPWHHANSSALPLFLSHFNMQPCLFLLAASAARVVALASSEISILLPTTTPSGPQDPWECALSAYTPFFNPPLPTGAVKSALDSYGDGLIADCTGLECPYPDVTRWCGITTAAPTAVLPAYTSYASSASVWWVNHSSSALELAEECPHYWYKGFDQETDSGYVVEPDHCKCRVFWQGA